MILLSSVCSDSFYSNILGWLGVLVAVLAVLVTLLLAWQIYSVWQMNKIRKEFEELAEKEINDYDHTISGVIIQLQGLSEFNRAQYPYALDAFLDALHEADKGKRKDVVDDILKYIYEIKRKKEEEGVSLYLMKDKRERHIKTIKSVKGNYAKGLVSFIESLTESKR